MELGALKEKVFEIFEIDNTEALAGKLFETVRNNDTGKYTEFKNAVRTLETDWLQKIYQYYSADRKEKKQDYTPYSLARFATKLAGKSDTITDMCAGSGALTIQYWAENPTAHFKLYELDENVIPYLLFNMAIRNVDCTIYNGDVLSGEMHHTYRITPGDEFGEFREVENEFINFKSAV